ncbi:Zn(2)-Cys(6) binuclear cluster domain-containing protein [Lentinula edodes]|nr:Zn(2)-Cys(6) binuclear cluster domain-containing protein [Lentinula edodes]
MPSQRSRSRTPPQRSERSPYIGRKCDGVKPTCSQCIKLPPSELEDQLCEYSDPKLRRTEEQVLKETIKTLEARIRELQISSDASVVKLHSPYQVQKSNSEGFLNPPQDGNVLSPQLLEAFLRHATDLNFFLHTPRFRRAVLLPVDSPGRPCQGLISVVFLLGFSLSERYILKPEVSHSLNNILNDGVFASASVSSQEALYLSRAQIDVAGILSSSHPDRIVHGIQAELLLSTYLFRSGRILEGKYHLSAATSIAFGAKLHKIRSLNGDRDILTSAALPWVVCLTSSTSEFENRLNVDSAKDPEPLFPHSVDPISEGERINAFWTVITMSNCWALAADSSPNPILERYMEDIDTPWPMDIEDYEKCYRFEIITRPPTWQYRGERVLETCTVCTGLNFSVPSSFSRFGISSHFIELDSVIDHFKTTLKLPISNDSNESILFTTHMIAHLATILLHSKIATMAPTLDSSLNSFPLEASESGQKRLNAAVSIAEFSKKRWSLKRNSGFETSTKIADPNPNPFLGSLWLAVGQVLIEEVNLVRVLSNGTAFTLNVELDSDENSPSEREAELMDKLECVFESAQMSRVYYSPLADYLFNKLQKIHRSRLHNVDDALPNQANNQMGKT